MPQDRPDLASEPHIAGPDDGFFGLHETRQVGASIGPDDGFFDRPKVRLAGGHAGPDDGFFDAPSVLNAGHDIATR